MKSIAQVRGLNLTWLALMALTLSSYWLAEQHSAQNTPWVLTLACFKIMLIGLVFMELKSTAKVFGLSYGLFFVMLCLGLGLLLSH